MTEHAGIERALVALRDELDWPPTPDLAGATRTRLAAEPARRPPRALHVPRLAPAVAIALAVIVALGAVLAASPDVRATLGRLLGIGAVRIERVDRLPDLAPARELHLGRRTTLAGAGRAARLPVMTIRALGPPDAVYFDGRVAGGAISLVHVARPGLPASTAGTGALLTELRGDPISFIKKLLTGATRLESVEIAGEPGFWIQGPHTIGLLDAQGRPVEQRPRLVGNTLVWLHRLPDGLPLTYRLETALDKAGALRLARSVG
ncbi:MAG: hypothetical protein JWO74_499 [Solirubrobacterales bacterium]|nr:hypothetical protein [Solirubrobacterales bacterium]